MDGHTQKHMHSHALSRRRGPSPPALGMGPAALDAFGRQLLHMGSVCLCVCASVFEGRRLGAGGYGWGWVDSGLADDMFAPSIQDKKRYTNIK